MAISQQDLIASVPTGLLIGGSWRDSSDGGTLKVEDPSTGEILTEVADATVADGKAALDAAVAAQADWAKVPPRDRGEILRSAFDTITERADDFAMLMTLEMGKTLSESRGEVAYGAEFFRWFAEEAVRVHGRYAVAPNGATRLVTMKAPVGPTLMITPWNFPLAMGTRKIGPAIAAGCTMVVKPAGQTPLSMLALAKLLQECGLPDGVLNVVTTSRTGDVMEPIIRDPRLRKLTFTGSTGVGRKLVEQSAQQLLRVSMELGGNAPFIVFEDADLDRAVEGAMLAKMRNIGEACTAANRFYVHESLVEDFGSRFAERMAALTVGRGTEDGVDVGPLIDAKARDGVAEMVEDAKAQGATVVVGGSPADGAGVLLPAHGRHRCPQDGPGHAGGDLRPGRSHRRVQHRGGGARGWPTAPSTALSPTSSRRDLSRMIRVSEALEFGMVGFNQGIVSNPAAPFGGVKASGFGREGGFEGIEEYLETKYVGIAP